MSLELQFQSIVASFLYGLVLGFEYGFFNRIFFHMKIKMIRLVVEVIHDCLCLAGYFFLIVALNKGHFNLYLYMALFLGIIFYIYGFSSGYLARLEYIMRFFRWLFYPIRFIFSKIHVILKHVRQVKRHGRKKTNKTE